jgi:hypothetical protein
MQLRIDMSPAFHLTPALRSDIQSLVLRRSREMTHLCSSEMTHNFSAGYSLGVLTYGTVMIVTMPDTRKRPCCICRHWFRPDPRVGVRQRACRKVECQAARRRQTQAAWRARNPDYFIARRIQERGALPWDLAQDQFRAYHLDAKAVGDTLAPPGRQDPILLRAD